MMALSSDPGKATHVETEELTFEELRSMAAEEQEAANGKEEEKAEPMEGVVEEKAEKAEVK